MALPNLPYIDVHTHSFSEQEAVQSIVSIDPNNDSLQSETVNYSVGLHPWKISSSDVEISLSKLEEFAKNKKVLAIGEIGLDRLTDSPLEIQEELFIKQIQIAEIYNKPIIIHCVKCFSELLAIKKRIEPMVPWIIHGFVKNKQIAEDLITNKCYLSFGYALLQNEKLQEVFKNIPTDHIFLETDDSDLNIKEIYNIASKIKSIELESLKNKIHTNFKTCFNRL